MMPLVLYILACVVVGILGRHRRGGFLTFALLSALTHPVLGAILLVLSAPVDEAKRLRKRGLRRELKPGERRPLLPQRPPDEAAPSGEQAAPSPEPSRWERFKQGVSGRRGAQGAA